MVVLFRPKFLKYQTDNPGAGLMAVYILVVLGTPAWVKAVRRMFSSSQTTTPKTNYDENVDNAIGFSTYNEESPITQDASGSSKGDKAEYDVPPK